MTPGLAIEGWRRPPGGKRPAPDDGEAVSNVLTCN